MAKVMTRDCAQCFDKFRSLDPARTLCKACEAEAGARLNALIASHVAQRNANNARAAMERRARFCSARTINLDDCLIHATDLEQGEAEPTRKGTLHRVITRPLGGGR